MRLSFRDRSGYTILELLLVMVMISILAAITYLRVAPALERARVRNAASLLATDLQYAQVLAARYRVPVRVAVDEAQMEYEISDLSGATVYRLRQLGDGGQYDLESFTATPASVQVFPNAIVDQSAQYTVGLHGYERRITFSRAGQIRVTPVP
jgi:prepilin-type N-terminal cleavage/methylation domain-containing protein